MSNDELARRTKARRGASPRAMLGPHAHRFEERREGFMTDTDAAVPRRSRRLRLVRVVAVILVFLLALLVSYALWTVYENMFTPATVDHGPSMNMSPSPRGELSPTAARALKAYGGEAVW